MCFQTWFGDITLVFFTVQIIYVRDVQFPSIQMLHHILHNILRTSFQKYTGPNLFWELVLAGKMDALSIYKI